MKTPTSVILLSLTVSHLAAVAVSYQLGLRNQTELSLADAAPSSSILSDRRKRISSPAEGGGSRFHPSPIPQKGEAFSHRLEDFWNETISMEPDDLLTSLKQLRHQPHSADKLLKEQALLARYAEVDPETALTYVARLGGFNHDLGNLTVMSSWAAHDPESASAHFEDEADAFGILDENQRETAGAIAAEWAARDLEAAMDWVAGLSPDVQGEAYSRIMAQAVAENPEAALALLDAMPQGLDRREMVETLAGQWAHQDPHATTAWLAALDPSDQITAMPHLMTSWMQSDPMTASAWLANVPAGAVKDSGIVALTLSPSLLRDPEAAMAWSTAIQDPSTRALALEETATRWYQRDPMGAAIWFGRSGVE